MLVFGPQVLMPVKKSFLLDESFLLASLLFFVVVVCYRVYLKLILCLFLLCIYIDYIPTLENFPQPGDKANYLYFKTTFECFWHWRKLAKIIIFLLWNIKNDSPETSCHKMSMLLISKWEKKLTTVTFKDEEMKTKLKICIHIAKE